MNTSESSASLDDRLSAWLDGELPPAEAAEVEAWLADRPEEAARVRLWAADRDALRARFGPRLAEPVPGAMAQMVWSAWPDGRAAWWRWAAAAAALFVLGGVAGGSAVWRLQAAPVSATLPASWVERAAVAHTVYVPEQRHPVEVAVAGLSADGKRAQEEHLARWLTKRLGFAVKLFDLRERDFELVGGRLLPDAHGPSAQLMYQAVPSARAPDATPARITVYLRKPPEQAADFAFRYEREGDLGLFYCVEDGVGYAIAGTLPREQLLALAESIHHQQAAVRQPLEEERKGVPRIAP